MPVLCKGVSRIRIRAGPRYSAYSPGLWDIVNSAENGPLRRISDSQLAPPPRADAQMHVAVACHRSGYLFDPLLDTPARVETMRSARSSSTSAALSPASSLSAAIHSRRTGGGQRNDRMPAALRAATVGSFVICMTESAVSMPSATASCSPIVSIGVSQTPPWRSCPSVSLEASVAALTTGPSGPPPCRKVLQEGLAGRCVQPKIRPWDLRCARH